MKGAILKGTTNEKPETHLPRYLRWDMLVVWRLVPRHQNALISGTSSPIASNPTIICRERVASHSYMKKELTNGYYKMSSVDVLKVDTSYILYSLWKSDNVGYRMLNFTLVFVLFFPCPPEISGFASKKRFMAFRQPRSLSIAEKFKFPSGEPDKAGNLLSLREEMTSSKKTLCSRSSIKRACTFPLIHSTKKTFLNQRILHTDQFEII